MTLVGRSLQRVMDFVGSDADRVVVDAAGVAT
jgi:hypothetical protein